LAVHWDGVEPGISGSPVLHAKYPACGSERVNDECFLFNSSVSVYKLNKLSVVGCSFDLSF